MDQLKKILYYLGIEPERLRIEEVSGGEGPLFVKVVTEFVEELKKLGPSPLTRNNIAASRDTIDESKVKEYGQIKHQRT